MIGESILQQTQRIGDPSLGIIIPAVILFISFGLTYMLYRRFSKKH